MTDGAENTMTIDPPADASGPLTSLRVIELAGIGPGPFAAMMLADMGATVIRVDRIEAVPDERPDGAHPDILNRGRRSIAVDLKSEEGRRVVLDLVATADVLIEGFRPGVTERLGLGPDACLARNPRLVYGRMTGWGQSGPMASLAGHDINYIALTGALHACGRADGRPVPPMNLVGDFGGGGLMLAFGAIAAVLEARISGRGQVVDAAMVDGASVLTTAIHGLRNRGIWSSGRGQNLLDTGAPFYEVYECADEKYVAVGAIEPQFHAELVRLTGMSQENLPPNRMDPEGWAGAKKRWAELFLTKTRDEWVELAGMSDACLAPVLDWDEAAQHPHLAARQTFVEHAGVLQPAPAPRFDATPGRIQRPAPHPGDHTDDVLSEVGMHTEAIASLRAAGTVR
ncbi:CaiB/BaiF CoA transferase family protein [Nocardioides sp. NPDC051685]|uniref:CaiB/BaiF CoA transferase family protein n=1 Tax=Nocardioides sp. NPDC051685 TaxID=3364334 RepID=UPI0037879CF9